MSVACRTFQPRKFQQGRSRLRYAFLTWAGPACGSEQDFHRRVNEAHYAQQAEFYSHAKRWSYLESLYGTHVGPWLHKDPLPPAVVDIGAGTGFTYRIFRDRGWLSTAYHYVEPSEHMRRQLGAAQDAPNLVFHDTVEADLLTSIESRKLVVTNSVLHHVVDVESFVGRLRRELAPGDAWLLAQEPNAHYQRSWFRTVRELPSYRARLLPREERRDTRAEAIRDGLIERGVFRESAPTALISALVDYGVFDVWKPLNIPEEWDEGFWSSDDIKEMLGREFTCSVETSFSYVAFPHNQRRASLDGWMQRALPMRGRILFCLFEKVAIR